MLASLGQQQQNKLVLALKNKDAYPHEVYLPEIKVLETHISWIFLTGLYAYKIKKAVKFGRILDFSTPQLRRRFCEKEIEVNRILCGDMYKGVIKLVAKDNGGTKITNLQGEGKPLEYGVKMLQIPQKFRMDNLVAADRVSLKTIDRLTKILVKFHCSAKTNSRIKRYGQPVFIKKKINENFETLGKLNREIAAYKLSKLYKIHKELISFITNNKTLFYQRIKQGRIREIHGDLYLGNIFVVNNKRFYLYDRIEFNDELRYADVTEDIAHLSMDLDYNRRQDLRKRIVSRYVERSNDINLKALLYFFMCYKASIRAKVSLFCAKNETDIQKRRSWIKQSQCFLELAESYQLENA
jgi:aminoglycoside phosphotransferase family enzyme